MFRALKKYIKIADFSARRDRREKKIGRERVKTFSDRQQQKKSERKELLLLSLWLLQLSTQNNDSNVDFLSFLVRLHNAEQNK